MQLWQCDIALVGMVVLPLLGCGTDVSLPPAALASAPPIDLKNAPVWDCGVVVPGQVTSVSFPFDDAAIRSASDIEAIESSCECVVASPFDYIDSAGARRVAARIEIHEPADPHSGRRAGALLDVILVVRPISGPEVNREVRFEVVERESLDSTRFDVHVY